MTSNAVVVVLAAGRGSRFAGPGHKLEQRLGGTSVLACTLHQVVASRLPMIVVTTAALEACAREVVAPEDILLMPAVGTGAGLGMGASIAAGVAARPGAPGWLVLPGDMPRVRPATIVAVAQALATHTVAFAAHAGRRGHPVAFGSACFADLVALRGDEGARRLVARHAAEAVAVDDPGVLMDVDTVADLEALRGGAAR